MEDLASIYSELLRSIKYSCAGVSEEEAIEMALLQIARISIDTVSTELKNRKIYAHNKFIFHECSRLINALPNNDLPDILKAQCIDLARIALGVEVLNV